MAIIKCKACGGDIELTADKTYGMCEWCGSAMTLPKIDDDQRASAFNRGNHFRRIGEFDKALAVYERIVREDDTDAEAHWCCALCRFGIEYVEDPATYEWLPTCHRASFDSFLEDVDYKAALEHSDGITRRQYQKDAAKIAEVQRGILATSQNTEPYDVFICYKESDVNGDRTRDSLLAQDIYYQLTEQGRKVFFARITLEDVAGTQYEPYIFAALNSAKVMIVVGTKAEYLNAVWVKNEWSRFLAMMKKDHSKLLLPCYRDMDPYDMPEALSVLQSYDMSKIGFIQDLTRGIAKVLDAEKKPEKASEPVIVQQVANSNITALLKRGNMALEDAEWDKADQFYEDVLNQDAECVEAYLGKLMARFHIHKQVDLPMSARAFSVDNLYLRAMRFASAPQAVQLKQYADENKMYLLKQGDLSLQEEQWAKAINFFDEVLVIDPENADAYLGKLMAELRVTRQAELKYCATPFDVRNNYQKVVRFADEKRKAELAEYIEYIRARNEIERLDGIYNRACKAMTEANTEKAYKEAAKMFEAIPDYKDSAALAQECYDQVEVARKDEILAVGKNYMTFGLVSRYQTAIFYFEKIPGWRDADEQIVICNQKIEEIKAKQEADHLERERKKKIARKEAEKRAKRNKKFAIIAAIVIAIAVGAYILINSVIIPNAKYNQAKDLMDAGNIAEAYELFVDLENYKDSGQKVNELFNQVTKEKIEKAKIGDIIYFGEYEQDNRPLNGRERIEWIVLETAEDRILVISKYALDVRDYNYSFSDTTWETCEIRRWLNDDFVNTAFSDAERKLIPTVTVAGSEYLSSTQDKVFLLSRSEAKAYFASNSERMCELTVYAEMQRRENIKADGGKPGRHTGCCYWWLRSNEESLDTPFCSKNGEIDWFGSPAYSTFGIRPAIWIDLPTL